MKVRRYILQDNQTTIVSQTMEEALRKMSPFMRHHYTQVVKLMRAGDSFHSHRYGVGNLLISCYHEEEQQ